LPLRRGDCGDTLPVGDIGRPWQQVGQPIRELAADHSEADRQNDRRQAATRTRSLDWQTMHGRQFPLPYFNA
jgi:hypothetical protein